MSRLRYLIVPGWHGSPADHWQSHWQQTLANTSRVEQADWLRPERDLWVAALQRELLRDDTPAVLIGHSLGCITVAHWARQAPSRLRHRVVGALLVAPADVDRAECPEALRHFAPVPLQPLPFPSVLVGSNNDPACSAARALALAGHWGAESSILAGAGHINVASGHRQWEEGFDHLLQLRQSIERRLSA